MYLYLFPETYSAEGEAVLETLLRELLKWLATTTGSLEDIFTWSLPLGLSSTDVVRASFAPATAYPDSAVDKCQLWSKGEPRSPSSTQRGSFNEESAPFARLPEELLPGPDEY